MVNSTGIVENTARCLHCGGTDITQGVRVSQTAEAGRIGLSYRMKFRLVGTEQLYADVCNNCGTVVRFFVKEAGRQWYVK